MRLRTGIGETTSVPVQTCRDQALLCHCEHVDAIYTPPRRSDLRGRAAEIRVLADVLDEARAGRGASLLLTGGPGLGKTALLDHTCSSAGDFTVLCASGVPDEADFPLAGLQRLLHPIADTVDRLPEPRRAQVREALSRGAVQDRFVLYTGLLELLTLKAKQRPLLLCVDDADQLDGASLDALAFIARRVSGTSVAVMLAAGRGRREPTGDRPSGTEENTEQEALVPGIPEHVLVPLEPRAIHDILTVSAPLTLPAEVRSSLVAAAHGNPAAVLGHVKSLSEKQLDGDEPLPREFLLPGRLRSQLLHTYRELPEPARRLLLLAALEPETLLSGLLDAAETTGVEALEPAEERGLVRIEDDTVRFIDPLLRAAVSQSAPTSHLRKAHRALTRVIDPVHRPTSYARHAAGGADGPDAALADKVEQAALRARRTDTREAASRAYEDAARLTPDPDTRACRLASASYQAVMAGNNEHAGHLLKRAHPLIVTDQRRAIVDLVDAQLAMRDHNAIDASERLLSVGRDLIPHDRFLALRALTRSADSASLAGDPVRHGKAVELALPLVRSDDSQRMQLVAAFLEGCAISFQGDYPGSTPLLRRATELARNDHPSELIWAGIAGLRLADTSFVRTAMSRAVELGKAEGERATIPSALGFLVFSQFWSGRFPSAAGTALSGLRASRESGQSIWATHHLASLAMIAAIQGDIETCQLRARAVATQAGENSLGLSAALAGWALAVLELSRGNAAEAFFRLRSLVRAGPGYGHPTMRLLTAPHFVEAATRMGETEWAAASLAGYRRWAESVAAPEALALAARCEGLLATGDEAADHFENALSLHRTCGDDDVEHARTQLLFGAFLRRARLPGRAREHLHNALESFELFGARLWVRQTRAELRALGTTDRGPESPSTSELTAQQQQIARLVAEGATNREVAAHMFISPRTVEHHLRGIFRKLNIRSRVDLARLFN